MAEKTRTELEFVAKGKGFEEQTRKAQKLAQAVNPSKLGKGFERMDQLLGRNIRRMRDLDQAIQAMSRGMDQFGRSVDRVDKLLDRMERRGGGGGPPGAPGGGAGRGAGVPGGGAGGRRGAFTQGLAQGLGFGPFLQRGPGMTRQAAGMAVGGVMRAPFAGLGGLAQGLANIPGIGLMAGPVQAALQGAQENLQLMQIEAQVAGLGGSLGGARRAGALARSRAMGGSQFGAERMSALMEANLANARREATRRGGTGELPGSQADLRKFFQGPGSANLPPHVGKAQAILEGIPGQQGKLHPDFKREMDKYIRANPDIQQQRQAITDKVIEETLAKASSDFEASRLRAGDAAASGAFRRQVLGGGVQGLGVQFGLNVNQARQMQLQLLQAGGGAARNTGDIMGAALGAQFGFGVDLQTSAQFLRAQRQGGIAGGGGIAGDMLAEAISNAMRMGLEGAEINEHLARVAQGIQQFQQTGIPVADQAISKMTRGFAMASTAMPGRGGRAVESIIQRAQRIAETGAPESALDVLLLRQAGGLTGGMGGFEQAISRLSRGEIGGFGGVQDILRGAVGGPGLRAGATGEEASAARVGIQAVLRQLGAGFFDMPQTEALRRSITGEALTPELQREQDIVQERLQQAEQRLREAASGRVLEGAAARRFGEIAGPQQRQAALENERLNRTRSMIGTLQNLEKSQNNLLHAVDKLSPVVDGLSGGMEQMSSLLPTFIEAMKILIDRVGVSQSIPQ